MFERFTKDARSAVVEAQLVARAAHSDQIDSRHVLVALAESEARLEPPWPTAASTWRSSSPAPDEHRGRRHARPGALAAVGIDLDEVTRRTEETFGEGALTRAGRVLRGRRKHIPFTPDAKKSLELALREAIRLGSKEINGGHLLLGMTRAESPARRILSDAGADVERVRHLAEGRARGGVIAVQPTELIDFGRLP